MYRDDTQEPQHQDELKFLVYKSHLLSLFTACRSCHQYCDAEIVQQMGTFIRVRQHCSHCGHEWAWNSQPFFKDTPAGNILLSASILFSGCTPGKVIHFLNCLRVACITDRTFYLHQTQYLEPAVLSVWKDKQHQLLSAILKQGSAIIIGGDGRADSPGHSAKFGSYGILDLNTNKVLHIELVQVLSKSIVHSNSYIRLLIEQRSQVQQPHGENGLSEESEISL